MEAGVTALLETQQETFQLDRSILLMLSRPIPDLHECVDMELYI